jgi:hypothetical protein
MIINQKKCQKTHGFYVSFYRELLLLAWLDNFILIVTVRVNPITSNFTS